MAIHIGYWTAIAYGLAHGLPDFIVVPGMIPVGLCRFVRNPRLNTSGKRAEQLVRRYDPYLGVLVFGSYITTLATMAVAGLGGDRRAHSRS